VTAGVPFARGTLSDSAAIALRDGSGNAVPIQVRALDRWSDGSVRWALIDFRAGTGPDGKGEYALGLAPHEDRARRAEVMSVTRAGGGLSIDTGSLRFSVAAHAPLSVRVLAGGVEPESEVARLGLEIRDEADRSLAVEVNDVQIEEAGTERSVLLIRAHAGGGSRPALSVIVRVHVFAGLDVARFDVTLRNPGRARHPGGIWELGDAGSVHLRDAVVVLSLAGEAASSVRCSAEADAPMEECGDRLELCQDSSGRPNWRSLNHVNGKGRIPVTFQGYRLRTGRGERSGLCATPIIEIRRGARQASLAAPEFWQNFPKAIEASASSITLRLFPGQYADTHELQGGEQKTHRVWAAFGPDPVTDVPLGWCRNPLIAYAEPRWYCESEAMPYLTPAAGNPHAGYLRLVSQAVDGDRSFERKRDIIDEYGWRNFGDIYADHEGIYHKDAAPLVSHYNNQYDAAAGMACQFFMTADPRWWAAMDELARHVADIDVYRTDQDKAAFNHGPFWHTFHYLDAGRSSHRGYPKAPGVAGGGPSNEHDYSTGLLLHHCLTGDPWSRETVVGLGEWVIAMDDGRRTVFRWLARGDTGLASSTASTLFHGPGRGAGNSIATLLNAHRLTGDRRFLDKAEQLIRRCIHPADDIGSLQLLDAERRWSYTVFLQQLGRYLACKAERGELDRTYAYARASLLHYARWMREHEYPYLEKPEILEYPTETWAAQDMRKCEVFQLAALHAAGAEREALLERARFFFDYSIDALSLMETRAFTRPVVIMLSAGFARAWFERNAGAALPAPREEPGDFGAPEVFVPQKARALRRAKLLAAAAGVIAVLGGVALLLALLA
jgi:hypothetical protein